MNVAVIILPYIFLTTPYSTNSKVLHFNMNRRGTIIVFTFIK